MRNTRLKVRASLRMTLAAVALIVCATFAFGQDETVYGTRMPSQAQKEADRLVSLSPETVIQILSDEPGLLLQVKKRLVKLAYEQGRLLEPNDLTDDAMFRLIRDDSSIRALATLEIEDRGYVRPKPTSREIDLQRQENLYWDAMGRNTVRASVPTPVTTTGQPYDPNAVKHVSQESEYWKRHEDDATYIPPRDGTAVESVTAAGASNAPPANGDSRNLNRANASGGQFDLPIGGGNPGTGTPTMPRISPNDLPDLVRASQTSGAGSQDSTGLGTLSSRNRVGSQGSGALSGTTGEILDPRDVIASASDPTMMGSSAALPAAGNVGAYERERDIADARGPNTRVFNERQQGREIVPQPLVKHTPNPYFNVPSLYDLYQQVSRPVAPSRFGADLFGPNGGGAGNFDRLPMDVPVGPEYVVGPGDGLTIQVTGGSSRIFRAVVDTQGRVALPEVGTVLVAGHSLGDASHEIQAALRSQFRDVEADVSLSRLRSVRVYVVGNVRNAGAYQISALSTPLNAIFEAGGPTPQGSLRRIKHMRAGKVIEEYDAYDLILHGVNTDVKALQPGDSIVVGEAGPQVTVEGMVRRPAIYEIRNEQSLAEVLELAGGVMSSGTLRHIEVERLEAHARRQMLSVDIPETNDSKEVNARLASFKIQDGDRIRIAPVVAYADKTVYLDGHLFHPGKYAWRQGMKISDVIKTYTDLLPEPYMRHAEIIRLNLPNFAPEVIGFNLADALDKKDADLTLQPFDTIRVFSRFDFEDPPIVTVSGEVRQPGDHVTNGATRISDAVFLAGGLTPDASTGEVQVYRKTNDAKLKVLSVDLRKALNGDPTQNIMLAPKDRIIIHKDQFKVDPPTVLVQGEVGKPGKYVLASGMTASQAIELAGGFKRSADPNIVDLARYAKDEDAQTDHQELQVAALRAGDPSGDVTLRDGDVLSIRQRTGWGDRGATITLRGEVVHPGTYGIREGEKLSSIIERAGGFTAEAYSYGAVFQREQVRELDEKSRLELIHRVEGSGDIIRGMSMDSATDPRWRFTRDAAVQQWQATLDKLKSTPPSGRMTIHISSDIHRWRNSADDITVRAGDVLSIPKKPNFIMIMGAVYNPSAVSYRPGRSAEWYLNQGGGPTQMARKQAMFVVHADGSVSQSAGLLFGGGLRGISVKPGDTIVVPERAIAGPSPWQTIFQGVQSFSSIAIASSVLIPNL